MVTKLETVNIIWLLVSAVGLTQAIFLLLLLVAEGRRAFRANRWLCAFIFAVSLGFVQNVTDVLLPSIWRLYLLPFFGAVLYFYIPSIYIYFRELSGRPVARPVFHYVLPIVMIGVLSVLSAALFQRFGSQIMTGQTEFAVDPQQDLLLFILNLLFTFSLYIQLFLYLVWIWRLSLRYQQALGEQMDGEEPGLKRWLGEFLIGITMIFVIYTVSLILEIMNYDSEWLSICVEVGFVLVFFRLGHLVAVNPALFVVVENGPDSTRDRNDVLGQEKSAAIAGRDTARMMIEPDEAEQIRKNLQGIAQKTDLLFDPLLTMPKMARAVGLKPNQLSFVLNRHIGKSFFDYVNEFRVNEAARLLVQEPDRTILDIAMAVGFNSKSTFNLAFKKITGVTPSAYRQQKT